VITKILKDIIRPFIPFLGKYKYLLRENYISQHVDISWWERHINNIVLIQYQSIIYGRVADFGCNHGACTILAARNPRITEIIGFDLNKKAINTAFRLLWSSNESEEVKKKVRFKITHLSDIKCPDNYFDSAYMFHVLEHIYPQDRSKIFSEIRRVMKREARLIITTPFEHAYNDEHQHAAFFNVESLVRLMKELGFHVVECYRDQRIDDHTPNGHDCLNIVCRVIK
jgi:ubiquinone/menaquinone biosynthesis C-methylase UbiE